MPIDANWRNMSAESIRENVPAKKGVYELRSFDSQPALYIGSSKDLRDRLLTHYNERNPNEYRFEKAGLLTSPVSLEQDHYDRHVEKYGEPPKWNDQRP